MPTPTPFRLLCRVLTVVTVELLLQIFLTSLIQLWLSCLGFYLRTGLILPSVLSLSTTVTSLSLFPSVSSVSIAPCLYALWAADNRLSVTFAYCLRFVCHSSALLSTSPPSPSRHTLSNCAGSKILAYAKL